MLGTFPDFAYVIYDFAYTVIYKHFCIETRLCNIFKTTNAIILTSIVIESSHKVLLDLLLKRPALTRIVQISKVV